MADLTFSLRGDTISAHYAPGGELAAAHSDNTTTGVYSQAFDTSTCIGGRAINFNLGNGRSWLIYSGIGNTPKDPVNGLSVVMRLYVEQTLPSFNNNLFQLGCRTNALIGAFTLAHRAADGLFSLYARNQLDANVGQGNLTGAYNPPINQFNDLVFTWGGTSTSNLEVFLNGTTISTFNMSGGMLPTGSAQYPWHPISIGEQLNQSYSQFYLNEFLLFDGALSAASVASAFPGPSRTEFYSTPKLQGLNSTDPGVASVNSGTNYLFQGNTLTGTLTAPTYTDPGVSNVANGTNYVFNDSTLTGTLSVPVASTGTAGTVPLNELKEQIRYVLAQNNTSTGAPVTDLSANLQRKVQGILKVNPEKIKPNDNILPCVTVFVDSKDTNPDTIARNAATGKRRAEVNLSVVGLVYEPFTTNYEEDPADEDLENLMENVEKILRGYDDLGGNVKWNFPTTITYHSLGYDEQNHYRGAIMDLRATVFY